MKVIRRLDGSVTYEREYRGFTIEIFVNRDVKPVYRQYRINHNGSILFILNTKYSYKKLIDNYYINKKIIVRDFFTSGKVGGFTIPILGTYGLDIGDKIVYFFISSDGNIRCGITEKKNIFKYNDDNIVKLSRINRQIDEIHEKENIIKQYEEWITSITNSMEVL